MSARGAWASTIVQLREPRRPATIGAVIRHRLLAVAVAVMAVAATPSVASAHDVLPDLGMAPLKDFRVDNNTAPGRTLLRYSAIVVNVGAGRFQVDGTRTSTSGSEMEVVQRIVDSSGGYRVQPTPARMYFAGDGHTHWHVADLEQSVLERLDNGVKVGSGAKHGFCFFDNYAYRLSLLDAPQSPFFTTCGRDPNVSAQSMGLSVGWGDIYSYQLVDQWIDITGLGAGRYRVTTTADAQNYYLESNETNNVTWVDLQLKGKGNPRVIQYGP
jgi:hypothetical protein